MYCISLICWKQQYRNVFITIFTLMSSLRNKSWDVPAMGHAGNDMNLYNRRKIQCMFSYKWDNKKQWWNLFIINTCIHFWNFTTKCDTVTGYGVQIWLFAKAQQQVVKNHVPCCHISHNSPLHYHNFAKHTIAVTQFHTSLCCSNTTLESTMHCHATTTIHTTPYHTKYNHAFVISNNILSHNMPLPYHKYAAGVTKLHTTPYQLSHNTH